MKRFIAKIIASIPRFPNNSDSLKILQEKSLGEILIDYFNWRALYIGVRTRHINIDKIASSSSIWKNHEAMIEVFLDKVKRGEDLTPHLSLLPHTKGYTPIAGAPGASSDERWSDKDQLLNGMNYHHFHLGMNLEPQGHAQRTNELLFAEVTRENFNVVAVFDHSVFQTNSAERMRLWGVHETIATRNAPAGAVVIGSAIASSGHALHVVNHAKQCSKIALKVDPQFDDPKFIAWLYGEAQLPIPSKMKFEWQISHLDFGMIEQRAMANFVLRAGWN
jgi:hypothetical protein